MMDSIAEEEEEKLSLKKGVEQKYQSSVEDDFSFRKEDWSSTSNSNLTVRHSSYEDSKEVEVAKVLRITSSSEWHREYIIDTDISRDGTKVVSCCSSGEIKLWDPKAGTLIGQLDGHKGIVYQVRFNESGDLLASCSQDTTLKLWDSSSCSLVATLEQPIDQDSGDVIWRVEGENVPIYENMGKKSKKIGVLSQGQLVKQISRTEDWINTSRGWIKINENVKISMKKSLPLLYLEFLKSKGKEDLLISASDSHLYLWDTKKHTLIHQYDFQRKSRVTCLTTSPFGDYVGTGHWDNYITLFKTEEPYQCVLDVQAHQFSVMDMVFSTNGRRLAVTSQDSTVSIWNVSPFEITFENSISMKLEQFVYGMSLCFSPDLNSSQLAVGLKGGYVIVLDMALGGCGDIRHELVVGPKEETYSCFVEVVQYFRGVANPSEFLLGCTDNGIAAIWRSKEGVLVQRFDASIIHIEYSVPTRNEIRRNMYNPAVVSKDGLTCGLAFKNSLTFFDVTRRDDSESEVFFTIEASKPNIFDANTLRFSRDGRIFTISMTDNSLTLFWIEDSSKQLTLRGHTDSIYWTEFSMDNKYILTASSDGTTKLWEVATGKLLINLLHDSTVYGAALTVDNKIIVTATEEGQVVLWSAENGAFLTSYDFGKQLQGDGPQQYIKLSCRCVENQNYVWAGKRTSNVIKCMNANSGEVVLDGSTVLLQKNRILLDWKASKRKAHLFSCDILSLKLEEDDDDLVLNVSELYMKDGVPFISEGLDIYSLSSEDNCYSALFSSTMQKVTIFTPIDCKVIDVKSASLLYTLPPVLFPFLSSGWSSRDFDIWNISRNNTMIEIRDGDTGELNFGLLRHVGSIESGTFSPDGKLFVSLDAGQVIVWDRRMMMKRPRIKEFITRVLHPYVSSGMQNCVDYIKDLLESNPGILNESDSKGSTVLHYICARRETYVLKFILDTLRELKMPNQFKRFALLRDNNTHNVLDLCIYEKADQCLELLLNYIIDFFPIRDFSALTKILPRLCRTYPKLAVTLLQKADTKSDENLMYMNISGLTDVKRMGSNSYYETKKLIEQDEKTKVERTTQKHGSKKLDIIPEEGLDKEDDRVAAIKKIIPLPDLTAFYNNPKDNPMRAMVEEGLADALGTPIMRNIIEFKWQAYGIRIFNKRLFFYLIYLLCFTLFTVAVDLNKEEVFEEIFSMGLFFVLVIYSVYYLYLEVSQIQIDRLNYFWNYWHSMDFLGRSMVVAGLVLFATKTSKVYMCSFFSIAAVFLWIKLLAFARGFAITGPLVRMIFQIIKKIVFFLIIGVIVTIGFSHAFYLVFKNIDEAGMVDSDVMKYRDWNVFLKVYSMIYGEFNLGEFDHPDHSRLALALLVVFTILSAIVMLNLLIAIMTHVYDSIQQNVDNEWLLERSTILLEIEPRLQEESHNPNVFPKWLHVIEPVHLAEIKETALSSTDIINKMGDMLDKSNEDVEQKVNKRHEFLLGRVDQVVGQAIEKLAKNEELLDEIMRLSGGQQKQYEKSRRSRRGSVIGKTLSSLSKSASQFAPLNVSGITQKVIKKISRHSSQDPKEEKKE